VFCPLGGNLFLHSVCVEKLKSALEGESRIDICDSGKWFQIDDPFQDQPEVGFVSFWHAYRPIAAALVNPILLRGALGDALRN